MTNQELVSRLKSSGALRSAQLEAAFRSVPRHLFLPGVPPGTAYQDRVVVTKMVDGRPASAVSQPSLVATMLEQLVLQPAQCVLEVGTGSGYATALMAHVVGPAGRVVSVEVDDELADSARLRLSRLGYSNVDVVCANGVLGHPPAAPFDAVIVAVGARDIAPAWWDQVRPHGRLVVPLWLRRVQRCIAFCRRPDHLESVSIVDCDISTTLQGDTAEEDGVLSFADFGTLVIDRETGRAFAAAAGRGLFAGPWRETPIGLNATVSQIFSGFYLWLALRERGFARLSIDGGSRSDRIRCLVHFPGKPCSTAGLVTTTGAAFMMPPREWTPCPDPILQSSPVQVRAGTFGEDDSPARRLTEEAVAWVAAGRPSTAGLRVRAFRPGVPVSAADGEHLIPKASTTLLLGW